MPHLCVAPLEAIRSFSELLHGHGFLRAQEAQGCICIALMYIMGWDGMGWALKVLESIYQRRDCGEVLEGCV